jgi:hypothetical protein
MARFVPVESEETLEEKLARLEAENQALKSRRNGHLSLKVSEKGGLSAYGLDVSPSRFTRSSGPIFGIHG